MIRIMSSEALVFPFKIRNERWSRYEIQRSFEDNFQPLKIYMWIHLMGYRGRSRNSCKNVLVEVMTVLLSLISTSNGIYFSFCFYSMLSGTGIVLGRAEYSNIVIIILNSFLRNLMTVRTKQVDILVHKIAKTYSSMEEENDLGFKIKLCLILLTNDVFAVSYAFFVCSALQPLIERFGKDLKELQYGLVSPPLSIWFVYASYFLIQWTLVCPVTSAYFSAICYCLKETLVALQKKVDKVGKDDISRMFYAYHDIAKLVQTLNKTYHLVMLVEFAVILGTTFRTLYSLMFVKASTYYVAFRIAFISFAFSRLVSVCLFATFVGDAASAVSDAILSKAVREQNWRILQFVLVTKGRGISFTLLNSIVIDSSLILAVIGHMATYGILIAAFSTEKYAMVI